MLTCSEIEQGLKKVDRRKVDSYCVMRIRHKTGVRYVL
jgi:hypothetical protein